MKTYCRIACCFFFVPFLTPAISTFTSFSQTSSHPFSGQHCFGSEKEALLQLKSYLSAANPESNAPLQPSSGYSLLTSWKPNTDCCSWESVTCHEVTRHVIGLNLSGHNLSSLVNSTKFLNLAHLERLNLVNCSVEEIPSFVQKLVGLVELNLSENKINGQVPAWIWQLKSLVYLNLSNNFLNGIEGQSSAPFFSSLKVLDLSSNLLEGSIPILPPSISFLSLAKNKLSGEIPVSLCSMSNLTILDICYNYMTGQIPKCLEVLGASLVVLNLRENKFFGFMLWNFPEECSLKTLNLYGNQLTGKIPRSLKHCRSLEVLDLGDNKMNDTFPFWLGMLPNLQVLILQSNRLHGPIGQPLTSNDFSMLQILDLSSNYFTGNLPLDYFAIWKSMKDIKLNIAGSLLYVRFYYYRDWMSITSKGRRMDNINILTIFTVLDLSDNLFEGEIPEVIGDLKLLEVLNLSRNNLIGEIPTSLSKLTLLESLDLSKNKLTGEIPMQLISLTFLSVLNLSYNRLEGEIPTGNQFLTFSNDSYEGNLGLCGFPLSKKCDDVEDQQPSVAQRESIFPESFSWRFALVGYGCGVPVGVAIGYILFWRTKSCGNWIEQSFKANKQKKSEPNRRRR